MENESGNGNDQYLSANAGKNIKLKKEHEMERHRIAKTLITGLMAIVFIIPTLAGAGEQTRKKQEPVLETSKTTIGSEVIHQEIIQILRKRGTAKVTLNIAGQPGVYFRMQYSTTGAEDSYAPIPVGSGVIGGNGFGSLRFDLKKLGKEEVYLKVTTSDRADFSKPRVTPKPLVLAVEQVKIKDRGLKEKIRKTEIEEWRPQNEPSIYFKQ
jgi:hypothetical protein